VVIAAEGDIPTGLPASASCRHVPATVAAPC